MTLLDRFDQLVSELRDLVAAASHNTTLVARLHTFLDGVSRGRPTGAVASTGRRKKRSALRAEQAQAAKDAIVRFIAARKAGAKMGELRKAVTIGINPLRRLLQELRARRTIRVEGERGLLRYFAAAAPARKAAPAAKAAKPKATAAKVRPARAKAQASKRAPARTGIARKPSAPVKAAAATEKPPEKTATIAPA